MKWTYRLQQRLAITGNESAAILVLAALFLLGLSVQYLQRQAQPFSEATYAEVDRLFEAATAHPALPESTAVPVPAGTAIGTTAGVAPPDGTVVREEVSAPAGASGRVNLNQATADQLQRLPRIGPKLAARILAYREAHGPFERAQDLTAVRGIGDKTLAGLEPLVYAGERP